MKKYKIGEVLATVTEEEQKEIQSSCEDQIALRALTKVYMEAAIAKEKEYRLESLAWWKRIALKYKLPSPEKCNKKRLGEEANLKIRHATRQILIGVTDKRVNRGEE